MDQQIHIPRSEPPTPSLTPPPSYISQLHDDLLNERTEAPNLEDRQLDSLGVQVRDDGRVDVDCHAPLGRRLSRLLEAERSQSYGSASTPPHHISDQKSPSPKLNIVIQVAGSRGDVQPFVALGCALQQEHGHRVRLATHAAFEDFVRSAGLEFYPLGGDAAELMAYIVKNPGIIPSFASIKAGDIGRKREMLGEMLEGCWKSCIKDDELTKAPFVADAIIANPPSMGHVHCAQALSIPLHIMFTMPWSTTRAFSHPLANLKVSAETSVGMANSLSFGVVEFMMWQGIGDLVNRWRSQTLELEPIPESEGPKLLERLAVPHTYCWSPALVPRPSDWPKHIDVCGFFFRDSPAYEPPADLVDFLAKGKLPIYIGFGSIVIDEPQVLTEIILKAVELTGVRALISRGWSKLGQGCESNDKIFFLDDCPHEWLFSRVGAVIHHGGAGTTACGLANGTPTLIVPFFGDQPFWGNMVASAGAGPPPIPHRALSVENLARSIVQCLEPETISAAQAVATKMRTESGIQTALRSFHAHLPQDMQCQVLPDQAASWIYKNRHTKIRISKKVASVLIQASIIKPAMLVPFRSRQFDVEPKRWDPVSAILSASFQTAGSIGRAAHGMVSEPMQAYKTSKSQRQHPATISEIEEELKRNTTRSSAEAAIVRYGGEINDSEQLRNQLTPTTATEPSVASELAYASAKSTGRLLLSPIKGLIIDVPLAAVEGMRAIPQLYGDRTFSERKPITDWKSGSLVGAQSFADGIRQGTTDIFSQTFARKKKEGALGVAKGLSMGLCNFAAKTSAATIGLVAYPCQGAYRSLYNATHTVTKDLVEEAKFAEAQWLAGQDNERAPEIIQTFLRLRSAH